MDENISSNEMDQYSEDTVSMTLENGAEVIFDVLAIFTVDEQQYIALEAREPIPGFEDQDLFFYRFNGESTDNADVSLDMIETEEEYEAVVDKFDEILDEEEFEDGNI